jgi:hypothetical protein
MGNIDCAIGLDAHEIRLNTRVPHCLDNPRDLSLREIAPWSTAIRRGMYKGIFTYKIHKHNNAPG